jgi:ABC-2 type transport system ATP-binding protein
MSFFEARNIHKQFADHQALHDVSIHVPEGSIYGLLGPNGAGKTTLIRIINRITAPDSGEIFFKDSPFSNNNVSQIGYLPEERGLYKKMKVGEQAIYLARLKGLSKAEAMKRLKYWFEKFEMTTWWNKKIEELSKGMAQKVQFIITILHDPELIILDEPFSGFDPVNANMLKQEVLNLKRQGKTIILSTHDMGSVEELCDSISLINKAKTILEGKVADIRQQYKSNKFELVYSGKQNNLIQALNGSYSIEESGQNDDGTNFAYIRIDSTHDGNDIIRKALEVGVVHTFREILPSMNDVFIQAVGQSQKQQA